MWDRLAPTLLPLPDHIGETPQGDLQDEGERPKHQGGRGDLSLEHVQRDVGMRLSRDVQAPDVPQLDQADPSGRDGERRDQSDEGEHPQHLRPVDLALGDADMPEGEQQDQVQREVADQRRDGERRPPLRYEPYRLVASLIRKWFHKPAVHWGDAAARFRHQTIGLIAKRWPALTVSALVSHFALYLVLLLALRHVGVSEREINWAQVLGVFAFVRLISAFPITPGGIGLVELGYIGGLYVAGKAHAGVPLDVFKAQVTAAAL